MESLIIYDSIHGNTEKIAFAIGEAIQGQVLLVSELKAVDVRGFDLLVIGSPTHGGWYTEGVKNLLDTLPAQEEVRMAVFDTRTKKSLFGFAAPRIARGLEKRGGSLVVPPEGFLVMGVKGPLVNGEMERAMEWAKSLLAQFKELEEVK